MGQRVVRKTVREKVSEKGGGGGGGGDCRKTRSLFFRFFLDNTLGLGARPLYALVSHLSIDNHLEN